MEVGTAKTLAYTTPRADIVSMVPTSSKRLLDVGCSNGALGASLKRRMPGLDVVGIEMDSAFASEARTHLDEVLCADLNGFDWAQLSDQTFHCIVFADVLEHLWDPQRHLLCAKRLLAPGGSFVIGLPNIRHVSSFASIFVRGTFPRRDRGIFDRTHVHWFTSRDAIRLIDSAGMHVVDTAHTLRLADRGGGIANRYLNRLPRWIKSRSVVREFFTYQFCFRATSR